MAANTLTPELFLGIDAHRRAARLSGGGPFGPETNLQRKRPLAPKDVKRMLLGVWGTPPGRGSQAA